MKKLIIVFSLTIMLVGFDSGGDPLNNTQEWHDCHARIGNRHLANIACAIYAVGRTVAAPYLLENWR